jgi:hypothetical protein
MQIELIIVAMCGLGLGWSCWHSGMKNGAERTIEILHEKKIIRYNNKGDIVPNEFYQEED